MDRLRSEWHRLFLPADAAQPGSAGSLLVAVDGRGSWPAVSRVWQGVQADFALPAPGIAVSGQGGYQLWFSLAQPVPADAAQAFLALLCQRYLSELPRSRIHLEAFTTQEQASALLPPAQVSPGRWSAFVAPDLAPLFDEEPWLDLPPGHDAQAELLSRLHGTPAADLQRALAQSQAAAEAAAPAAPQVPTVPMQHHEDPRRFLLAVMNDAAVPLGLRIEAAKALLTYNPGPRAA